MQPTALTNASKELKQPGSPAGGYPTLVHGHGVCTHMPRCSMSSLHDEIPPGAGTAGVRLLAALLLPRPWPWDGDDGARPPSLPPPCLLPVPFPVAPLPAGAQPPAALPSSSLPCPWTGNHDHASCAHQDWFQFHFLQFAEEDHCRQRQALLLSSQYHIARR